MSDALPKIAALGYYGFGNLGDEAVLSGIRTALGKTLGATDFLALSACPQETTVMHTVRSADRWRLRDLPAVLKGTDLFILGGGSLLQDATSAKSVLWYGVAALLARRACRRVLWWSQGIGPLRQPISRLMVAFAANQADALTVRDEKSGALLKEIGVRGSIETVADAAFALSAPTAFSALPESALVALRPWKNDVLIRRMVGREFAGEITARTGGTVSAFPMHLPDDADFAARYFADASAVQQESWQFKTLAQTLGVFSAARIVVAMRLHALIFAARCGVPFVAIAYDPKVESFAEKCGQQDTLISVESLNRENFAAALEKALQEEESRRAILREFAETQHRSALRPAEIAQTLL